MHARTIILIISVLLDTSIHLRSSSQSPIEMQVWLKTNLLNTRF